MRDLHLGIKLAFETAQDQEDSEDLLLRIIGVVCKANLIHLRKHPEEKNLYDSGVVYTPPDQADGRPPLKRGDLKTLLALLKKMGAEPETALMMIRMLRGIEVFLDIPAIYRRGKGDCNELALVRVAELWRAGIAASPWLTKAANEKGGTSYHCLVRWPDGSSEDPSLILGMGNKENADLRREEIRKNSERWQNYMQAAQRLIHAEGASPEALGRQVDSMGLIPSNGIFRSPYGRVTSTYTDVGRSKMRRAA
jgi:hypothetical protein